MPVSKEKIELLSELFRDLEAEIGTEDLTGIILDSLRKAVKFVKHKNISIFKKQFTDLSELVSKTEPKFAILMYYLSEIEKATDKHFKEGNITEDSWKRIIQKQIKAIQKYEKIQRRNLLTFSEGLDVEQKVIMIHDHSHTVHRVLSHYKQLGKHFKVVIAEQNFEKTHLNIERMHQYQIPFQVVPSYMLSHVHDEIDMVFFGALTLKDTMDFVMAPGTYGVISEFHSAGIPVYNFINSTKFSLWKSKSRGEVFVHKHMRTHYNKPIDYERIKYSHDRVPAKFFQNIVTNEGSFTPTELKQYFDSKMKK